MTSGRYGYLSRPSGHLQAVSLAVAAIIILSPSGAARGQQDMQQYLISQSWTGDVMVYVDIVSYKNLQDPSKTYVEIYYAFDRKQMTFVELPDAPGVFSSLWEIETVVETEIGDRVTWSRWNTTSQERSREETERNRDVFDIYKLLLEPGTYIFITTVTDHNSRLEGDTRIGQDRRIVVIPDFSAPELTISDIEFTARLGQASSQNMFVKNGLFVLPNPLKLFGLNIPIMSFYAEIYGLSNPASAGEEPRTYTRSVYIEGLTVSHRQMFENQVQKDIRSSSELIAISDMNVQIVPSGDYRLVVEIVDQVTGDRAIRSKPFRVISSVQAVEADELVTIDMTDEAIIRLRNEITYLTSSKELDDYDSRDSEGKRTFLIEFWSSNDPNPATPQNEFREAIIARFRHANDNFATPTQPEGWKTDQGRIWIVYGQPDEIDPHMMDGIGKPWVQWFYNRLGEQGRSYFIFGDSTGFGSFVLFHTNVTGEPQNPEWRLELGIPPR